METLSALLNLVRKIHRSSIHDNEALLVGEKGAYNMHNSEVEYVRRWCHPIAVNVRKYVQDPFSIYVNHIDVIMGAMASQITSLAIVYSTVYSGADQRKHQSSASLAFVRGIHRWPVNSPHKWPVTRKIFPFDDVIMTEQVGQWGKTLQARSIQVREREERAFDTQTSNWTQCQQNLLFICYCESGFLSHNVAQTNLFVNYD